MSLLGRKFIDWMRSVWIAVITRVGLISIGQAGSLTGRFPLSFSSWPLQYHSCVMLLVINESMLNISSAA
jgi:hypothetical protein